MLGTNKAMLVLSIRMWLKKWANRHLLIVYTKFKCLFLFAVSQLTRLCETIRTFLTPRISALKAWLTPAFTALCQAYTQQVTRASNWLSALADDFVALFEQYVNPIIVRAEDLFDEYYPYVAVYVNPWIKRCFRFIRWSYRAVNRPLDRLITRYLAFCRRHGIYVEEENLRLRWMAEAPVFISVFIIAVGLAIIEITPHIAPYYELFKAHLSASLPYWFWPLWYKIYFWYRPLL